MKWNVAVYLRVSKEVDDLCETNSLDNQKLIIENFVNNNQDLVIKDYYIDNGYTGTNMERPALEQMMDDIHNGKINCVIVKDMSRFARNYAWCQIYLGERLPSNNVRFISINDNLDSLENPNYTDKLEFVLLNLVYEH